jgi:hypothetical protein
MNETGHNTAYFKCNPESVISPNTQRPPKTPFRPVFGIKKGILPDTPKKLQPLSPLRIRQPLRVVPGIYIDIAARKRYSSQIIRVLFQQFFRPFTAGERQ